ncbi:MAG: DUF421 domain-containing protein [Firmicutes bacterium]|nr:DUF421 domain-containing protein [Bacillota bacterium]
MPEILAEAAKLGARTLAIYAVAIIVVKLMGKRELGQLSPMDFVVGVIIGSVASAPMVDLDLPLLPTLVPLLILGGLEIVASTISLKNRKFRLFIEDKPTIIIRDGHILKKNMDDVRMNIDDLKQELRKNGIDDINEVKEGTLESGGAFSIIKKQEYQPITPQSLQTQTLHILDRAVNSYAQKTRQDLQAIMEQFEKHR